MSTPWSYLVAAHPVPLCRDFVPQPDPARYWCATCGWKRPLHDDDTARKAIAAELARITPVGCTAHLDTDTAGGAA